MLKEELPQESALIIMLFQHVKGYSLVLEKNFSFLLYILQQQQQDNTSLLSIMVSSPLVKFEIGRVTKSVFERPYLGASCPIRTKCYRPLTHSKKEIGHSSDSLIKCSSRNNPETAIAILRL